MAARRVRWIMMAARVVGVVGVALVADTLLLSATAGERSAESRAPRVDYVVPSKLQPQKNDAATIWYDDFDDDASSKRYAEAGGELTDRQRLGSDGKSLEMHYAKGARGNGGRKVFFGDSPTYTRQTVRRDELFQDVYWRIYVKHQEGWAGGGPAKLSRATSLVPPGWRQSMIAHVWSSGEALTLDPASGVRDGKVVTTGYNDFENLRWLGNKPVSRFLLHSAEESGRWVCVEARARLNTPGKRDGLQQLWIDGRLESERTKLDWRGTFEGRGINAVFIEAYWNSGSPVDQSRWIDLFVVSEEPIGPVVCPRNPTLVRTPYRGKGDAGKWEVEVAAGASIEPFAKPGKLDVVWRSTSLDPGESVKVTKAKGKFGGSRRGRADLKVGEIHYVRIREVASGAKWSDWHQPFITGSAKR